jgi:hypothetical protein
MPKALEEKLKREVNSKHGGWSKERKNAYIYSVSKKTIASHRESIVFAHLQIQEQS